jgi:hypothetical protein
MFRRKLEPKCRAGKVHVDHATCFVRICFGSRLIPEHAIRKDYLIRYADPAAEIVEPVLAAEHIR